MKIMNPRIIAVVLILAMAAGSTIYIYGSQRRTETAAPAGESKVVEFDMDKAAGQSPEVDIDFESIPDVIAEVAGNPVGSDMYVRLLKGFENTMKRSGSPIRQNVYDKVRGDILNNIVNAEVLTLQADKESVTAGAAAVEERLTQVKSNFPDEEAFAKSLETQGLTEEIIRKEIERTIRVQALVQKNVISKIEVTGQEARDYYDLNQLEFEEGEKVRAAHILSKIPKDATEEQAMAAKARMEGLLEKIKDGADFAELASSSENDDKAAAAKGGEIGLVGRNEVVPEFADEAFKMNPGDVSGVVETRFGYHIIKVLEKVPPRVVPFEEAGEKVKEKLLRKRTQAMVMEYINGLRKEMDVKILI